MLSLCIFNPFSSVLYALQKQESQALNPGQIHFLLLVTINSILISFINLNDVSDVIRELTENIHPDWNKHRQIPGSLCKLEQKKAKQAAQMITAGNLQR